MKQAKTLTPQELKAVFAHVVTRRHGARDRAIVGLSFYAGLRAHEIASLTVSNVLGVDGRILSETLLDASQTKGRRARKVFLSDKLRDELKRYCNARGPQNSECEALFLTQKARPFTANAICHLFLAIYQQVGLRAASSHSGRRTFITKLASKGVSVRVLAALAGHASISTTQRYIDVNDEQIRCAIELM